MRPGHIVAVAVLIGVAAAIGTYAATRTTELGAESRAASHKTVDRLVTAQTRRLDAFETSLRKMLARKPPKLPPLPKAQVQPQASVQVVYSLAPAPVVRISRPAPVVTVRHTAVAAPVARHGEQDHVGGNHASSGGEHGD
ncbi:MAG: hypothetical protein ABSC51_03665 [Gaiellaceae bacterium]